MLKGIDISNFQANVDYEKIKGEGIQAAYLKATEGTTYQDKLKDTHYKGMKSQNILVGFYHFFRANKDSVEQAKFFINTIKNYQVDLKYVCDVETTEGIDKDTLSKNVKRFTDYVRDNTSIECVIYTGSSFSKTNLTEALKGTQLWLAHYTTANPSWNTNIWDHWSGWQYSSSGKINGINGNVDMDQYKEELLISNHTSIPQDSNNRNSFKTNATAKTNLDARNISSDQYIDLGEIFANERVQVLPEVCDKGAFLPILYWKDSTGKASDKVWVNSKQLVLGIDTNATVINVNTELDARYKPLQDSDKMGYVKNGEKLYVHQISENYVLATYFAGEGYKTAWFTKNYIKMD